MEPKAARGAAGAEAPADEARPCRGRPVRRSGGAIRWPWSADGTVAPVGTPFFFFAGFVGLGESSSDCPLISLSSMSAIEWNDGGLAELERAAGRGSFSLRSTMLVSEYPWRFMDSNEELELGSMMIFY